MIFSNNIAEPYMWSWVGAKNLHAKIAICSRGGGMKGQDTDDELEGARYGFKRLEKGRSKSRCRLTWVHTRAYSCAPLCVISLKLTFEDRTYFPNCSCPFPVVLAQCEFHVEQWHSRDDQEKNVGDQKSTWKREKEIHFVQEQDYISSLAWLNTFMYPNYIVT